MAGCADDPTCRERLGDDPWAVVGDLLQRMEHGHCAELAQVGLDDVYLRVVLATMLKARANWPLIAPLVHRLDRCDAEDRQAVLHLLSGNLPGNGSLAELYTALRPHSWLLEMHLVITELTSPAPSDYELAEEFFSCSFATGYGVSSLSNASQWQLPPEPDPLVGGWAAPLVPVLALNGALDGQTPPAPASEVSERYGGPHQTYVELPRTGHVAILQSPTGGAMTCGLELLTQFLQAPEAELDLSCRDRISPIDYAAAEVDARATLGRDSAWE
jgi:hypothetical protein